MLGLRQSDHRQRNSAADARVVVGSNVLLDALPNGIEGRRERFGIESMCAERIVGHEPPPLMDQAGAERGFSQPVAPDARHMPPMNQLYHIVRSSALKHRKPTRRLCPVCSAARGPSTQA